MGAAESTDTSGFQRVGYHVLQVHPNSPGEAAGLQSYFDFIVAVEGIVMDKEDARFVSALKDNVGKPLKLSVYNRKTDLIRETYLTPNPNWGGSGLAGISIRFCTFEQATENVWHILDIYQNSPAAVAGLQAHSDYIVGSPELLLSDSEDFFTMVELFEKKGKTLPLYVYSSNTDSIRLVQLTPNRKWGGNNSCLGCDIGTGYLHRIPMSRNILPATQLTNLSVQYPTHPGQVSLTAPMSPVSVAHNPTEKETPPPFYSPQANFSQYTPMPTTPIHSNTAPTAPETPAPAETPVEPSVETQPVQEEPKP